MDQTRQMKAKWKRIALWVLLGAAFVSATFAVAAKVMVIRFRDSVFTDLAGIPKHDVGLLLGTSVRRPRKWE